MKKNFSFLSLLKHHWEDSQEMWNMLVLNSLDFKRRSCELPEVAFLSCSNISLWNIVNIKRFPGISWMKRYTIQKDHNGNVGVANKNLYCQGFPSNLDNSHMVQKKVAMEIKLTENLWTMLKKVFLCLNHFYITVQWCTNYQFFWFWSKLWQNWRLLPVNKYSKIKTNKCVKMFTNELSTELKNWWKKGYS